MRWREINSDGKSVGQSWTFYGSPAEAKVMAIQISQAIRTQGYFERPEAAGRPTQPTRPDISELTDLFAAFYDWRINVKGARGTTPKTIAGALVAFEHGLRVTQDLQEDQPIPVTMLTTRTCTQVLAWMRVTPTPSPKGRRRRDGSPTRPSGKRRKPPGGNRLNQIMRYVHQAWEWGADEGEDAWPGLPDPPRQKSRLVPEPPVASDALEAPTWDEMDMLVRAARSLTRPEAALAPSTIPTRLTALRSLYNFCVDEEAIARSPAARARRPKVPSESPRQGVSPAEVQTMIRACDPNSVIGTRDRTVLVVLSVQGWRISELLGLRVEDLGEELGHRVATIHGKGGKISRVPLAGETWEALAGWIELSKITSGPLVVPVLKGGRVQHGKAMTKQAADRRIKHIAKCAGIERNIQAHFFRHGCATAALDVGRSVMCKTTYGMLTPGRLVAMTLIGGL